MRLLILSILFMYTFSLSAQEEEWDKVKDSFTIPIGDDVDVRNGIVAVTEKFADVIISDNSKISVQWALDTALTVSVQPAAVGEYIEVRFCDFEKNGDMPSDWEVTKRYLEFNDEKPVLHTTIKSIAPVKVKMALVDIYGRVAMGQDFTTVVIDDKSKGMAQSVLIEYFQSYDNTSVEWWGVENGRGTDFLEEAEIPFDFSKIVGVRYYFEASVKAIMSISGITVKSSVPVVQFPPVEEHYRVFENTATIDLKDYVYADVGIENVKFSYTCDDPNVWVLFNDGKAYVDGISSDVKVTFIVSDLLGNEGKGTYHFTYDGVTAAENEENGICNSVEKYVDISEYPFGVDLKLYDLLGNIVWEKQDGACWNMVKNGVYFLRVSGDGFQCPVKKIVVTD